MTSFFVLWYLSVLLLRCPFSSFPVECRWWTRHAKHIFLSCFLGIIGILVQCHISGSLLFMSILESSRNLKDSLVLYSCSFELYIVYMYVYMYTFTNRSAISWTQDVELLLMSEWCCEEREVSNLERWEKFSSKGVREVKPLSDKQKQPFMKADIRT